MDHGIHVLDTGFHRARFDAAYLIVENGRAAFIDCGTSHSVPALLRGLEAAGLAPADVDWLILTHAHLDHAGGAGALMRCLPNARLVAHPRAAPHMIDPARLAAGAIEVYGEETFAQHYGALVPVGTKVYEWLTGGLANGGESLQLDRPGAVESPCH